MCLASRLSTQVNLLNMSTTRQKMHKVIGNIALVQVQATVAGILVAILAIVVGIIAGDMTVNRSLLVIASSMFTATSSCLLLGKYIDFSMFTIISSNFADFILVAVVLTAQKMDWNPDNVAPPLAASVGDVVAISLFSGIASYLHDHWGNIIYKH